MSQIFRETLQSKDTKVSPTKKKKLQWHVLDTSWQTCFYTILVFYFTAFIKCEKYWWYLSGNEMHLAGFCDIATLNWDKCWQRLAKPWSEENELCRSCKIFNFSSFNVSHFQSFFTLSHIQGILGQFHIQSWSKSHKCVKHGAVFTLRRKRVRVFSCPDESLRQLHTYPWSLTN